MRAFLIVVFSFALVAAGASRAGPRDHGTGDTSRHPRDTGQPAAIPVRPRGGDRGVTHAERVDPAVRQFWSDRCVDQRRYGLSHSRDCDNPAYTGGTWYRSPHRRFERYDGHRLRNRAPRGGATLMDREGGWRMRAPGSAGSDERPDRGRSTFHGR